VGSPTEVAIDVPDEEGGYVREEGSDGNGNASREVVAEVVAGRGSSYFLTKFEHVYATGESCLMWCPIALAMIFYSTERINGAQSSDCC